VVNVRRSAALGIWLKLFVLLRFLVDDRGLCFLCILEYSQSISERLRLEAHTSLPAGPTGQKFRVEGVYQMSSLASFVI
jgi:hypothetical protein